MQLVKIFPGSPPIGEYRRVDGTLFHVQMVIGPNGWQPNRADWNEVAKEVEDVDQHFEVQHPGL